MNNGAKRNIGLSVKCKVNLHKKVTTQRKLSVETISSSGRFPRISLHGENKEKATLRDMKSFPLLRHRIVNVFKLNFSAVNFIFMLIFSPIFQASFVRFFLVEKDGGKEL